MPASRQPSPVEIEVEAIIAALRAGAAAPDHEPTFADLIKDLGGHSHTLVILVFCALNMIPGPPGYGGTIAVAIFSFAFAMIRATPVRLPGIIGKRRLPLKPMLKMFDTLVGVSRLIARFSKPRWQALADDRATLPLGLIIMVFCLPMVVPIPLMNAVPNVGIAVMCVSRLNRDGLGMAIGVVIGTIGVIIDVTVIGFVISLGLAADGMLRGQG